MPGARVTFKSDRGELNSDVELTDSEGEARVTLQSETAQTATITIQVEKLTAVTRTVKFVP
jgi:hypothetical protein